MRIFNRFFAALFCLSCVSICRSQDVNSLPAENDATVYSFGVSGTMAFVNPKELNESFHMVNTTLDLAVPRVNTIFVAGAHLRMSVNAQSHIVLRGEFIRIFRQFEYDAKEISLAGVQTGVFRVRNERSYHTFPIGLGAGTYLNRQKTIELEIGFMYVFSVIEEKGTMESYGPFQSTMEGRGWGVWGTLRPRIALTDWLTFAPEISGRFLSVDRFQDQRDRTLQDFALDFRGVSIGGALFIHLNSQGSR